MRSFQIIVTANGCTDSGTGWLASPHHVVTAWHVVGNASDWVTARFDKPTIFLLVDGSEHELLPIEKDLVADLAVLSFKEWVGPEDAVGEFARTSDKGIAWASDGFPELHRFQQFGMAGTITSIRNNGGPDDLQLLSNHPVNARTRWEGMSGSPVRTSDGIVGVITRVQDDVNTAWAASAVSVRRLLSDVGVAVRHRPYAIDPDLLDAPLYDLRSDLDRPGPWPHAPLRLIPVGSSRREEIDGSRLLTWGIFDQSLEAPLVLIGDTRPDLLDILQTILLSCQMWTPEEFVTTPWIRVARRSDRIFDDLRTVAAISPNWLVIDFSDFGYDDPSLAEAWRLFQSAIASTQGLPRTIVALPRWLLAHLPVADWLKSQSTAFQMAARYSSDYAFRAAPFPDLAEAPQERRAICALLHANSNGLQRAMREGLSMLSDSPPELRLLRLAEFLFRAGYAEEAIRLELFSATDRRGEAWLSLTADVEPVAVDFAGRVVAGNEQDRLCGFLSDTQEAPKIGNRILLTGDAGAGKTTTILQIERRWALPDTTLTCPHYLPLMFEVTGEQDLCSSLGQHLVAVPPAETRHQDAQPTLFAHARLARVGRPELLSFVFSSPILFMLDGITEKTVSHASACLRDLNSLSIDNSILVARRPSEVASLPTGQSLLRELGRAGPITHVSLRALNVEQLRTLCTGYGVDASYANAMSGPELGKTLQLRNPYLCSRLLAVTRNSKPPDSYTIQGILGAYVGQLTRHHDHDHISVLLEILPKFAHQIKLLTAGALPSRVHAIACVDGILDPQSTPESSRFVHRLLEDYFTSLFIVEQMLGGMPLGELVPGHPQVWSSRWEYVLPMVVVQLNADAVPAALDYVGARDLRLAIRCAKELDVIDPAAASSPAQTSLKLVGRIEARWTNPEALDESLKDGGALGHLDPRLARASIYPGLIPLLDAPRRQMSIGRFPVTNLEFARFVNAGGYDRRELWKGDVALKARTGIDSPRYWNDEHLNGPNCPVVGVSFFEAQAYCEWLSSESIGEADPMLFFLPSTEDWDNAAGIFDEEMLSIIREFFENSTDLVGSDPAAAERALEPLRSRIARSTRRFTDPLAASRHLSARSVPRPIGLLPPNSLGCSDMIGHVWEWCVRPTNEHSPEALLPVVKGGPLWVQGALLSTVVGGIFDPHTRFHQVGFRIAAVSKKDGR
jgi:formylglycine-generating enzyme required for sulfatase activity